jgi:hypothetical protein
MTEKWSGMFYSLFNRDKEMELLSGTPSVPVYLKLCHILPKPLSYFIKANAPPVGPSVGIYNSSVQCCSLYFYLPAERIVCIFICLQRESSVHVLALV